MKKSIEKIGLLLLLLTSHMALQGIDNHHFYRASNFFPFYEEPRFSRPGLTSLDVTIGGGATRTGLFDPKHFMPTCMANCCDNKTNILNICGLYNIQHLITGVPGQNPDNPLDAALINLAQLPAHGSFANLAFSGSFSIFEMNVFAARNFFDGFFGQIHFPIRQLRISNISYTDCSPSNAIFPNKNTPEWQAVIGSFHEILAHYGVGIGSTSQGGIGDTTFLLGWTNNYERTEILDFLDLTVRLGLLTPTGKSRNPKCLFSLPLGYNGHMGVPVTFDLALGMYEWLTIGFHFGALPFVRKIKTVPVRTSPEQHGPLQLATACVCVQPGILWDACAWIKADHCIRVLSFWLGYTYAQKNRDSFSTRTTGCIETFCPRGCDFVHGEWKMHTMHVLIDYDPTALCAAWWTPHIGFFLNAVAGGKNVFKTPMAGLASGINVVWRW